MTELMRQNEKRARCASLLKFGYVIFFLPQVTYWLGKNELQAVEYQGSELGEAQLRCCKPFNYSTNRLLAY